VSTSTNEIKTEKKMKIAKWMQASALFALGLMCASVLMLTQNSKASVVQQQTAQVQRGDVRVTQLPAVVVTAKRLSATEKAKYQQMLKTSAATII
jgi:hypothetical protein